MDTGITLGHGLMDRLGFRDETAWVPENTRLTKMQAAEEHFATLRVGLVALNTAIFLLVMDLSTTSAVLAALIIASSWGYAAGVLFLRPYDRFDVQRTCLTLTVLDGGLIASWIFLTGGIASPFYVLWYVAIGTVAFRYSLRATLLTSILYTAVYLVLLALMGNIVGHATDVLVRTSYIPVVGGLGGLFAHEYFRRAHDDIEEVERVRLETSERVRQEVSTEMESIRERLDKSANMLTVYAERLARSSNELDRYQRVTHHELQEPLRDVVRYAQLLERRYGERLDEEGRQYVAFIVGGTIRLQALLRDLLSYSQLDGGPGDVVAVPAERVLDDVLRELQGELDATGAMVTHDQLPTLRVDPLHLRELLRNILENAVRHAGNGAPRVHVSGAKDARGVHLAVRDEGPGIDPRYHERIFQVFQRLAPRDGQGGTGMGLAICRKIMEGYGGRITLESTPGNGSTFHLWFPPRADPGAPVGTFI